MISTTAHAESGVAPAASAWRPVATQPTTVLCLRHTGAYADRIETWKALTGYLFERGLCGPKTVAVGVLYDDPATTPDDKVRFDACLSVTPDAASRFVVSDAEAARLAVRLDVILDDGWLLYCSAQDGSQQTTAWASGTETAPWVRGDEPLPTPIYQLFPHSPAFLPQQAAAVGYFVPLTGVAR
jgi:hypothetical protein